ncbi:MAG: hypothetical protein H9W81_15455 [Enterococcus sp.]|nr:hypothetical protein [Enterococcus sp.]
MQNRRENQPAEHELPENYPQNTNKTPGHTRKTPTTTKQKNPEKEHRNTPQGNQDTTKAATAEEKHPTHTTENRS